MASLPSLLLSLILPPPYLPFLLLLIYSFYRLLIYLSSCLCSILLPPSYLTFLLPLFYSFTAFLSTIPPAHVLFFYNLLIYHSSCPCSILLPPSYLPFLLLLFYFYHLLIYHSSCLCSIILPPPHLPFLLPLFYSFTTSLSTIFLLLIYSFTTSLSTIPPAPDLFFYHLLIYHSSCPCSILLPPPCLPFLLPLFYFYHLLIYHSSCPCPSHEIIFLSSVPAPSSLPPHPSPPHSLPSPSHQCYQRSLLTCVHLAHAKMEGGCRLVSSLMSLIYLLGPFSLGQGDARSELKGGCLRCWPPGPSSYAIALV